MAHRWYISIDDREDGPYSVDELEDLAVERRLLPEDYVWHEGMPRWQPADEVLPELFIRRRRRAAAPVYDDGPRAELEVEDKPTPQFPGRLVSPSCLVFALIAACLPWVDVHCNGITIISQSGLQTCFGSYTRHERTLNEARQQQPGMAQRLENATIDPAPMVIAAFSLFLVGLLGGLALRVGAIRAVVVGGCTAIGFALLVIQVAVGFPISHEVTKANEEQREKQIEAALKHQKQQQQQPRPPFGRPPLNQPPIPQPPPFGPNGNFILDTSLSPFFWFTPLCAILAFGALAIEHFVIFAKKRKRYEYY